MVAIMTKDAKKSLAKIYKTYQERRSHGMDKLNSKYFDPSDDQETLELAESVREDIPELKKIGFVKAYITGQFELQDQAIVYMENVKAETIKEWLSFGSNLIP
ncbi:MAG: hypothetical protein ACLSWS_06770 [Faecalispora jeddahensis]